MSLTFNLISIPTLVAFIFGLNLLVLLMYKEYRVHITKIFTVLLVFVLIWDVFQLMLFNEKNPENALMWARLMWTSVAFVGPLFLHMALRFPKKNILVDSPVILFLIYFPILVVLYFVWFSNLLVLGTSPKLMDGARAIIYGKAFQFYAIYAYFVFLGGLFIIFRAWRTAKTQRQRSQGKWIFYGALFPVIGGTITNVLLPSMHITVYPMATVFTVIMCLMIANALIKYRFVEVSPHLVAETIISMIPHIVVLVNTEQKIVYVNKTFVDLLGYEKDEILGKHIKTILAEDSLRLGLPWQKMDEKEKIEKSKIYLLAKNREVKAFIFSGTVSEHKNELNGLVGIAMPVEK